MSTSKQGQPPSIATPSAIARAGAANAAAAAAAVTPPRQRDLPPVMHIKFSGGELVELLEDQTFADGRTLRAGRRGKALYPSSQAASWVVYFPDEDDRRFSRFRVLPERLLRRV